MDEFTVVFLAMVVVPLLVVGALVLRFASWRHRRIQQSGRPRTR